MSSFISAQSPYLLENGPVYPVIITPSFVTLESLKFEKRDVPFVKAQALLDTGAQSTSVSRNIIEFLKLVPRGSAKVHTSQSSKIVNKYDIALEFDSNMYLNTLPVFSADLRELSIDCLIGRDVLRFGVFTYDGPRESFRLSFG